jgi:ATP-binding cassette subfamily B protein
MNTIKILKKITNHLDLARKKDLVIVFIFSFLASIAESVSIAILIPFVSFFLDPNSYLFNNLFKSIFFFFNLKTEKEILTFISFSFITIVIISGLIKLKYIKKSNELIEDITSDFRIRIFNFLLSQDYSYYFKHGSNEIMSNLSQKTNAFSTIIFAAINILNSFLICSAIILILIINDPLITPVIIFFVSGFFLTIFRLKSKNVSNKGQSVNLNQNYIINIFENAVGYLQEIIIYDLKKMFSNSLANVSKKNASYISNIRSTAMQPRIYVETFFIIAAILFIFFSNLTALSIQANIAFLAILAYGMQKTLPQVNNIYNLSINFKAVKPTIVSFLNILDGGNKLIYFNKNESKTKIKFNDEINLKDICFKYEGKKKNIFEKLNFKIKKGEKIVIKGTTGSGKTTLVNIITSLLAPSSGSLFVDGTEINEKNKQNWQKNIALAPQNVFLNEGSILENIMLGYNLESEDKNKLNNVIQISELQNFIKRLPNDIHEKVGERGIRISGGQRQRIGIARALYRDTDLIILDEPTNALDFNTETKIFNSLIKQQKEKTIIVISHSEKFLKLFDKIIDLDEHSTKDSLS